MGRRVTALLSYQDLVTGKAAPSPPPKAPHNLWLWRVTAQECGAVTARAAPECRHPGVGAGGRACPALTQRDHPLVGQ